MKIFDLVPFKAKILIVAVVVLAAIGYLARLNHLDFEKAIIRQAQQELLIIAKSEGQAIEKYLGDIDEELLILASEDAIQQRIIQRNKQNIINDYLVFMEASYKDVQGLVDRIDLIDSKGHLVDSFPRRAEVAGQDLSKNADVKEILVNNKSFTSNVFNTPSGKKFIANLQPIFKNGEFIGLLRAVISVERVNDLFKHINKWQKGYFLIIDDSGILLSFNDAQYVGKNFLNEINENFFNFNLSEIKTIVSKMMQGQEGSSIVRSSSRMVKPKINLTLLSYSPIHIGNEVWSIGIGMDYNSISSLINTNARDNIIFSGFVLLVLCLVGVAFYRVAQKNYKAEVAASVSNIINKQLRVEIEERKRIQEELSKCLYDQDKKSPPKI